MSDTYIQLASQGRNHWWRYLLGTLLTFFLFFAGSMLTLGLFVLYIANDSNPLTQLASPEAIEAGQALFTGIDPLVLYVVYNLAFPFFLLGIYLSLRLLHGRGLRSLITPQPQISYRRIWQGFWIFFVLKVLEILTAIALTPSDFTLNFQPGAFLSFLPFIVLLTPLQTATEELFFRGYLLQGVGYRLGKWAAILFPSVLFALMHLSNPEVTSQAGWTGVASLAVYYFMIGAFLAWLTVKENTLELAMGVHAANNMATFLLVTSKDSVIPSPAIFSVKEIEASFSLVFFTAVWLLAFSVIVFRVLRRPLAKP
ncbi:MAG: CPBP family intramembrane glutamic endopeptidase [Phormidesmis sp.]